MLGKQTPGFLSMSALARFFFRHRELEPVGPTLFRYGFAFSIGLTLFPVAIISLFKFVQTVRVLLQHAGWLSREPGVVLRASPNGPADRAARRLPPRSVHGGLYTP